MIWEGQLAILFYKKTKMKEQLTAIFSGMIFKF